ncbi:MAG: CBS domain-containing protein [Candidatus Komeilibacteria bacterium]
MKVQDLMDTNFITIKVGTPYQAVVETLFQKKLTGAPVVDKNDDIVGFVSEKDLFRILYPFYHNYYKHPESYTNWEERESKAAEIKHHPVEAFMSHEVISVRPGMPILSAGAMMLAYHVHNLPVVKDKKIVGMITRETIYHQIFANNFFNIK